MKKKNFDYLTVISGILLLACGFALLKLIAEPQGIMLSLPYICIGLGCGSFGHGLGNIVSNNATRKNPDVQKQLEIEKNDERNITIANKAKARAYDIMIYVFGALMLSFALMSVDLTVILLLVFTYLFVIGASIYYLNKFSNEM